MSTLPPALDRAALQGRLLAWFDRHRRDLPWRRTRDPYAIWVAEVMLQQTRVAAVLAHYQEFLRRFPTVQALAKARLASVLAAWSGLGYYRRARSLHAAAKIIARDHDGQMPEDERALSELPGIGGYTAAAIASTAFGRPCAVVDGNVERILTRMMGLRARSSRRLWEVAEELLSHERPGDFNQAMMELGATICVPGTPRCAECPLQHCCATRGPGTPARAAVRRKRRVGYVLAVANGSVYLVQRDSSAALMPGMWELPEIGATRAGESGALSFRHSITDTDYQVTVVRGTTPDGNGRWIRISRAARLPLTGLTRKILRRTGII